MKVWASSNSELYEKDFAAWSQETAEAIRRGSFSHLDLKALADEIEDMGRNDKRELKSRLTILIAHLLKYQFRPEHRSPSWRATMVVQRQDIARLLEQSPSLKRLLLLHNIYPDAKELAAAETGLAGETAFPLECPYTVAEIFDSGYWPGD